MIPDAVELSVYIGVGCWGCSISSNMLILTSPSFTLMNRPPNSTSEADAMTLFRMAETSNNAPFCLNG